MKTQIFPVTRLDHLGLFAPFDEQIHDFFFDKNQSMKNIFGETTENITEDEKSFYFHIDLPGVAAENLKLDILEDRIYINAKRKYGKETEKIKTFEQYIRIPRSVDKENIEAHYRYGVLEILMHKIQKPEPKNIKIHFHE